MLKLIMGVKGMGKTKTLIEMVNDSAKSDKGDVICIEKGSKLTFDISHDVRLIDITPYEINDFNMFYGFVSGIFASDYDITSVYIDSVLKICGDDLSAFGEFLVKLDALCAKEGKTVVMTASGDQNGVPEDIKKFFAA